MSVTRSRYSTDLSDAEWRILAPLLPEQKTGGRHRLYPMREIINAIQYVLRSGGAWRLLPHDLPHWRTAYEYFRVWKRDGTWLRIHDHLHEQLRLQMGRNAQPSAAVIDSQSVKTTEKGGRMVMTGRRRSAAENATFSLIQRVWWCVGSSTRQTSQIGKERS
jgi:transposase